MRFRISHRVLTKMEDACRQYRIGATVDHSGNQMFKGSDPPPTR